MEQNKDIHGMKLELARSEGSHLQFELHTPTQYRTETIERFHHCIALDNKLVGCHQLTEAFSVTSEGSGGQVKVLGNHFHVQPRHPLTHVTCDVM